MVTCEGIRLYPRTVSENVSIRVPLSILSENPLSSGEVLSGMKFCTCSASVSLKPTTSMSEKSRIAPGESVRKVLLLFVARFRFCFS